MADARGERADIECVRILHLAASTFESRVEDALDVLLAGGERFDHAALKAIAAPEQLTVPDVQKPYYAATIDRIVHHSVILEFDGPSIRAEEAKKRNRKDQPHPPPDGNYRRQPLFTPSRFGPPGGPRGDPSNLPLHLQE